MEVNKIEDNNTLEYVRSILDNKLKFDDRFKFYYYFDNKDKGIVAINDRKGLLIKDNKDVVVFTRSSFCKDHVILNKDGLELSSGYKLDNFEDECMTIYPTIKENNIESTLYVSPTSDDYIRKLVFTQLDDKNNIECRINFDIYGYGEKLYLSLINNVDSISINNRKNYIKIEIDEDEIDYLALSIYENGLINTIKNSAYGIYKQDSLTRYAEASIKDRKNNLRVFPWPLSKYYLEEEMKNKISKMGFKLKPNKKLVELYNHEEEDTERVLKLNKILK